MSDNIYYHYTTVFGAHEIIHSRRIWLTDYRFLNDKQELRQGFLHFVDVLPEKLRDSFLNAFHWHNELNHHCVLSLSRSPKILSQWRAYSDDATGFALGFSEQFLNFYKIKLIPCQYESHESHAAAMAIKYLPLVESIYEARQEFRAENEFANWVHDHRNDLYSLVGDVISIKNPAFIEEQEIRAVLCAKLGEAKTRVSGQVVIPYLEVNFWDDTEPRSSMNVILPEIWLGPKSSELNQTGIQAMFLGICNIKRYDCGYV